MHIVYVSRRRVYIAIIHSLLQVMCKLSISESRFKGKHSLDSDEEDEKDEVEESRLGDEDLAAQEEATIVIIIIFCTIHTLSIVPCVNHIEYYVCILYTYLKSNLCVFLRAHTN